MIVEPPKDAGGREIPLDTKVLYAGDCTVNMCKDIVSRIHKLRGEGK